MTQMPPRVTPEFGLSSAAAELARRHRSMAGPYAIGTNPLLANQQARESNARSYPRRIPLALRHAAGIYVEDVEGRVFIDCLAGAGTLALGHNHPVITAAIQAILDSGSPLHTLDLTTPTKDRFMADLFDLLPPGMAADAKVQFCSPSGSDAIEAAMKLVRIATGRAGMVAFSGAYHGMTQGALSMMGSLGPKRALHGLLQNVQFAPYPYDYRCPFGLGGQAGVKAGLHYLETLLSDPESGVPTPAGLVVEPVQGEGGVIPAPDAWLRGLRDATARHDVPLIVDEVQTGFGRTGRMFAIEHAGITPDVLVLSKAIGGALPLSVVVYRGGLDAWQPGAHAGTFRGNQMAMAAGSAAMRFIRDEGLPQHAARMGERLTAHLRALQEEIPALGDVRGRGLMLGVEIVQPNAEQAASGPADAAPELAQRLQALCLRHGLILELGGRHGSVVRFLPPLIIDASQIDDVARIFGDCARQVCGQAIASGNKDPVVPM